MARGTLVDARTMMAAPEGARVRRAAAADVESIARIWHDAWQDAHAHLIPAELTRVRTRENFRERTPELVCDSVVVEDASGILGFCTVHGDELYQCFVDRRARGSGCAALLMQAGERLLADNGVTRAWLACAIGNDRAGRFYEKCGWERVGNMINHAVVPGGTFALETWRYEKEIGTR